MTIMALAGTLHYSPRYKIFPEKEVGASIGKEEQALINHITRKSYFIHNFKEGSHGRYSSRKSMESGILRHRGQPLFGHFVRLERLGRGIGSQRFENGRPRQ